MDESLNVQGLVFRPEWWEQIVAEFGPSLYYTIARFLPNQEDREDVLQETLARAWWGIDPERIQVRRQLGAFLDRIARNQAINRGQYNRRRLTVRSLDEMLDNDYTGLPSYQDSNLEAVTEGGSDRAIVSEIVNALGLPQDVEAAIYMRMVDFTWDEIAAALDTTKEHIYFKVYRLRPKIEQYLMDTSSGVR